VTVPDLERDQACGERVVGAGGAQVGVVDDETDDDDQQTANGRPSEGRQGLSPARRYAGLRRAAQA
jgi:hypothetical protein